MVRAAVALVSTVAGLILLLGYKTASGGHDSRPAALAPQTRGSAPPAHRRTPAPPTRQSARAPRSTPAPATTRVLTGSTVQTPYGPVQVRATVRARTLTDVTAIQLPDAQARSQAIAGYAIPILRQEALAAGDALINVVSGATYDSDGYARSLQSALDQAGIR